MTTIGREDVLALLREVPEPCALLVGRATDIVAMGLVDDVAIAGRHVEVTLVLTDASCVHFGGMKAFIRDVLERHEAVDVVDVRLSTTTIWTPDRVQAPPATPPTQRALAEQET